MKKVALLFAFALILAVPATALAHGKDHEKPEKEHHAIESQPMPEKPKDEETKPVGEAQTTPAVPVAPPESTPAPVVQQAVTTTPVAAPIEETPTFVGK